MDEQAKEDLMKQIYYDPATGLSSAMALYNRVKVQKITLGEVKAEFKKKHEISFYDFNRDDIVCAKKPTFF